MNPDLVQLISHYLDINEFIELEKELNLNIKIYLRDVKCPTRNETSYGPVLEIIKSLKRMRKVPILENEYDLYWACCTRRLEIVKHVFESMNEVSGASLWFMSMVGYLEIVKYLDINLKYDKNIIDSAISIAKVRSEWSVISYLTLKYREITEDHKIKLKRILSIREILPFSEKIQNIIMKYLIVI